MTGLIIYMLYPDFGAVLPILGDIAMYAGFICLALATVFAIISAFNYIIKKKTLLYYPTVSKIPSPYVKKSYRPLAAQ